LSTMRLHRGVGWLVTLSCLGAAVAGCGSSRSTSNGVDPVAKAASVSTSAPGYKVRFSMRFSSQALPTAITGTGTGAINTGAHSGSISIDMNLGSSPQITQVLGSSTLRIDEVIRGLVVYVKLPAAIAGKLPGSKPWLKVDVAKAAAAAGIPGISSLTNNPLSGDPSQILQYLRAVSGGVKTIGSETVNGIQTTHYRGQINLDHVPDVLPAAQRASAKQAIAALEKTAGLKQLPIDVWIDGQQLVRRTRVAFKETVSGQALDAEVTSDILSYGPQPVPATPPADQVTDLSSLLPGGG